MALCINGQPVWQGLSLGRTAKDFEIVTTADGSPSLRIADATGYVEKMHHSAGAFSESLYIYGGALNETLTRGWPLRALSLGIGLGYNELLFSSFARRSPTAALHSFETEPFLAGGFRDWVMGTPSELSPLYDEILAHLVRARPEAPATEVVGWLRAALTSGQWQIHGAFPQDAHGVREISCVLYDAFSNKMCPELWRQDLIETFLREQCGGRCVFSTYAATGSLNRALAAAGFARVHRVGFSGKRESTLAIRDVKP